MGVSLRALLVEDSEADVQLLLRELRNGGFEVTYDLVETAEDMSCALQKQEWDIVLSDYSMPRFSGRVALALLREIGLDLPFIIVSGKIGEETAVDLMKAGAHDYIIKGNLKRLVPAIQRELRDADVRRERREADEALRKAHVELERRVEERTEQLEKANRELQAEVAQRKKIEEERESFIHMVSHDLRSPITSISGYAQILQRNLARAGMGDNEGRMARAIIVAGSRMNVMIQDLIDSARLASGQLYLAKEPLGLDYFIPDLLERATGSIEVSRVRVEISPDVPPVVADPNRLERILLNLLANALKYSQPEAEVVVTAKRPGEGIEVSIADNGVGIASEDLPHLFERFYRAEGVRKTEGLGLGLHITKMLVDLHGGTFVQRANWERAPLFTSLCRWRKPRCGRLDLCSCFSSIQEKPPGHSDNLLLPGDVFPRCSTARNSARQLGYDFSFNSLGCLNH